MFGIRDKHFPNFKRIQDLDSNGMPIVEIEENFTPSGASLGKEITNVDDLDECKDTTDDATGEECPSSDKTGWYIKLKDSAKGSAEPVSYTHLTLPTILRV